MATASVIYEGVRNTTGDTGKLFEGQSFWFSSAVPQRQWLIENTIANGGTIVPLEKQADVLIVDHARKNAPIGTHSYRYIEQSIRNGTLEDLAEHVVGPTKGIDRPVGSMVTAAKGSRSKYTEEEDQLLWNFVKPYEDAGGATGGNLIYKQLEDAHGNGRHTYQSWRDRWLKHVKFQNRQITETAFVGDVDCEAAIGTQGGRTASPLRRIRLSAQPPASSPRRRAEAAIPQARLPISPSGTTFDRPSPSYQTWKQPASVARTNAEPSNTDRQVAKARESLQRKIGRLLSSSPSSLSARHWEPIPSLQRPQDTSRKEAIEAQRREAGLGTHTAGPDGSQDGKSDRGSRSSAEGAKDDGSTQDSEVVQVEFTDEEYQLLVNAAGHIIRMGEGEDEDSWEELALNYPAHDAVAWREFWLEVVKPDYEKGKTRIKKEQPSREQIEKPEKDIRHEVAAEAVEKLIQDSSSGKEPRLRSQSEREDNAVFEEVAQQSEVWQEQGAQEEEVARDGLSSLFESQASSSSSSVDNASPYACRWLDCDADFPDAQRLVFHVGNDHKPRQKVATDERGLQCLWAGCKGVEIDEYGNEILTNLRTMQQWVHHYINQHITPIKRRETRKARRDTLKGKKPLVHEEDPGVVTEVDPDEESIISPQRRRGFARAKEEEGREQEVAEDQQSEQADDSESSAINTPKLAPEVIDLSSDAEEVDDDHNSPRSPRRNQRRQHVTQLSYPRDEGFSYVDKAVGSSPPFPAQDNPRERSPPKSPTFQPLSPSFSKPPEPNEARKRSAGKGTNSHESNPDQVSSIEVSETQPDEAEPPAAMSSPRKRSREPDLTPAPWESPKLPPIDNIERMTKRRKRQRSEDEASEIPSTPEHRVILGELRHDDDDDSMLNGLPTPRPAPGDALRQIMLGRADSQDEEAVNTSPLHISMVSDPGVELAPSSPAQSASTRPDDLSSEPDLQFETAPNATNLWGTAPSEEFSEGSEQYETAPEPKGKERERLDTQSLFAQSMPDIDDDPFALPEPEGGWPDDIDNDDNDGLGRPLRELPIPPSHQPQAAEDDDDSDDDASSISSIPEWVAQQTAAAKNKKTATVALLRAIQATSGVDEALTLRVRDFIIKHNDLPRGTSGCWSEADDDALKGSNRKELARVREKHSRSGMERRRLWLHLDE